MKRILAMLMLGGMFALLTGCATGNPYSQFYKDNMAESLRSNPSLVKMLLPPQPETEIRGSDQYRWKDHWEQMASSGYTLLGVAAFSGRASAEQLLEQAKNVGADVVVAASNYSHTESGVLPWVSYQPGQTSTTYNSGTVSSAYGTGNYSGTSTTTTPGTYSTQYIPYQTTVYDYGASFWRRTKPPILGIFATPVPDDVRANLARNSGAYVKVLVDGSPAYKANILKGDVIVKVGEKDIEIPDDIYEANRLYAGQKVTIRVVRASGTKDLEVQLNPDPTL